MLMATSVWTLMCLSYYKCAALEWIFFTSELRSERVSVWACVCVCVGGVILRLSTNTSRDYVTTAVEAKYPNRDEETAVTKERSNCHWKPQAEVIVISLGETIHT